MAKKKTIEEKVAKSILETDFETIEIGARKYTYGKPTLATIIMVSELVSKLPTYTREVDSAGVVHAVMQGAKDERVIGEILACLILGAKRIKERRLIDLEPTEVNHGWRFWRLWRKKPQKVLEYDYVAQEALDNLTVNDAVKIISQRLGRHNISGFFALTTSLKTEANMLAPTKTEVEHPTIASGQ